MGAKDRDDDEKSDKDFKRFDGTPEELEAFNKYIGRKMRKKYGMELGNGFWEDSLPELEDGPDKCDTTTFEKYCRLVMEHIEETDSSRAGWLEPRSSGFWNRKWHVKWRGRQLHKMYDLVESCTSGEAEMEVEDLGMEKAHGLKKHITKCFGGAGDDVRAREEFFRMGMPKWNESSPFPNGCDVVEKCRQLHNESKKLRDMCPVSKRPEYEVGMPVTLVKIVMKHTKGTEYEEAVDQIIQEIKMQRKFLSKLPVVNRVTGALELPTVNDAQNDDDWDFRNYSDEWLPSWTELRSKLVSVYKGKQFEKKSSGKGDGKTKPHNPKPPNGGLPAMLIKQLTAALNPGFGSTPKPTCWACGEVGHRRGDVECKKGPNDVHGSAPDRARKRPYDGKSGSGGPYKKKVGNGFKSGEGSKPGDICRNFRDKGKCRFGDKCIFKHVSSGSDGPPVKKVRLTKVQKKQFTAAAVKTVKAEWAKHVSKQGDGEDLQGLLESFMFVRTIPRTPGSRIEINITALKTSPLLCMTDVGWDSCSASNITCRIEDMVSIDTSKNARESVMIRGPSVGTPTCGGIGVSLFCLDYEEGEDEYGIIGTNCVYIDAKEGQPEFRLAAAQEAKWKGLRILGGEFEQPDRLECVRTREAKALKTKDGILVLETKGTAEKWKMEPRMLELVEQVEAGKISPLVNLTKYFAEDEPESPFARMSPKSALVQMLFLFTVASFSSAMLMNEAKLNDVQLTRLYCRRFGMCNTNQFEQMQKMPEYGDMPRIRKLNEDNRGADLAKFSRKSYKRNDPSITMSSPPWWRSFSDAYGGGSSMGGTSYEGAIGGYLFVCPATGADDIRFYSSHDQYPVAMYQFLTRVEAEHYKCKVMFVDTHSINISEKAEYVAALFKCQIMPVSAGTPQEMAFVESRVRTLKRKSTAQMLGAPHLPKDSWALSDKYASYTGQFLPQSTRNFHCSFWLRTGKVIQWDIICLYNFGAPLTYELADGPVHKRSAIAGEGYFMGVQWPAALVRRKSDMKILSVSTKKIRVYEAAYLQQLDQSVDAGDLTDVVKQDILSNLPSKYDTWNVDDQDENEGVKEKGFGSVMGEGRDMPEVNRNMVQSIKSLRQHRFPIPIPTDQPTETTSDREIAAQFGNFAELDSGGEGLYIGECQEAEANRVLKLIDDAKLQATSTISNPSIRSQVLKQLTSAREMASNPAVPKGALKKGKKKNGVSQGNIVSGKRRQGIPFVENDYDDGAVDNAIPEQTSSEAPTETRIAQKPGKKQHGRKRYIKKGDLVSAQATIFDGDVPGSYSDENPEKAYGVCLETSKNGLCKVKWHEGGEVMNVKMIDLTLEVQKATSASIIVLLSEGGKVSFEAKDKNIWPKDFFQLLVKSDWRRWVAAVKKEIAGWTDNNAVTVIDINEVPATAKIVPLGELYSIKRDGTYKFRQYIMGNLLREGVDFADTFSTTISGAGLCTFFSIATTCEKEVWGWDAICGYLQVKEQFDVFAYMPSHQEYSELEYEELGKLRMNFLELVNKHGEKGLKQFAAKHKRDSRCNPKKVLKCNSGIYGNPGVGHSFEMLMHAVHTKHAGLTQTQPEPSLFVKIVVDGKDEVTGYLIAMAWTDDVRVFGTTVELEQYLRDVQARMKITIENPPVSEFVSIETHQDFKHNTCELKMPKYWSKAAEGYASLFPDGMKARVVPLTPYDEKILLEAPTEEEVKAARDLPWAQLTGVMSYPASNCKFEMRYSVSLLGSRRSAWSEKQFKVLLKVFEYGFHTREIGLIYSKGLDPHGENEPYGYSDSNHRLPRSQGCRVVMLNGAAIIFKSKKQTLTAPSTCWAEATELFNASTDVLGVRNLLTELGMRPDNPTKVYCDNQACIQIANNRGSLGMASRAMELRTLSLRNRIEDHQVETEYCDTTIQVGDQGTKALPENPFVRLRDVMNGYALVRAAYPDKELSPLVYSGPLEGKPLSFGAVSIAINKFKCVPVEDLVDDPKMNTRCSAAVCVCCV